MAEYGTPTVADGSGDEFVIVSAAFTGRENTLFTELLEESTAVTVNPMVLVLEGVPVSTPLELREKPDGRPEADHEYWPLPPEAENVAL